MPDNYPLNRVVAWNLKRARELKDWTAERTAAELEPFLGQRWSKSTFSTAEAYNAARVRQFSLDELLAFSRAFELNVSFFLTPGGDWGPIGVLGAEKGSSNEELLDAVHGLNEETRVWLSGHVPRDRNGNRALAKWRDDHEALVTLRREQIAEYEQELAELVAAREALDDTAPTGRRETIDDLAAARRRDLDRLKEER